MKKLIVVCVVLLMVQLGLAVLTHLGQQPMEAQNNTGPLLTIPAADVRELLFEDAEGRKLALNKEGDRWVLPGLGNVAADSARIQELLIQLTNARRGWPEATTAEAASRFKVAADRFERRLTLRTGGKDLGRIYFGSSPGLRKVYLRVDGDSHIQALALESSQLDLDTDSWIDTGLLRLEASQIKAVKLPDLRLLRQGETIQPADLREGEEAVKERVESLIKAIADLRIVAVLSREARPEDGLDKPVLHFTVELTDGRSIDYLFAREAKPAGTGEQPSPAETAYILKVSGRDELFRVDGWQVEEIRSATRATLVRARATEAAATKPEDAARSDNRKSP